DSAKSVSNQSEICCCVHFQNTWRCSICRRKMQSRAQPVIQQDSTDSLLDVPMLEALQRRHSDVKINAANAVSSATDSMLVIPPRSPELRRHSDVSAASLKELQKLQAGDDCEQNGRSRPSPPIVSIGVDDADAEGEAWRRRQGRSRRMSRVTRQHSYDDELKNASGGGVAVSRNLCLPVQLPRRASAYDVYAARSGDPAQFEIQELEHNPSDVLDGVSPTGIPTSSRRPSFRAGKPPGLYDFDNTDTGDQSGLAVDEDRRTRRRGSQL
ncbi:hypothetical protein L9F63_017221, partial [Diploptera punctata]